MLASLCTTVLYTHFLFDGQQIFASLPPQLEARGCSVVVETVRSPELGDTLKRERAEQKKLLADTHSAAMDLRCRLENSEKGWVKEKSELLERFEAERKEWENQLMDMQRRIEEVSLRMCATPHSSAERTVSCFKLTPQSTPVYFHAK